MCTPLKLLTNMSKSKRIIIQLSEGEKQDIERMFLNGIDTLEISEYIGCCRNTVYYHLRKMKLVGTFRWTEELDNSLMEYRKAGIEMKQISCLMNIPEKRVCHRLSYLRKLGRLTCATLAARHSPYNGTSGTMT